MPGRIVLLVTSPRLPAGLLTAAAWDLVRAHPVLAAAASQQSEALRAASVVVRITPPAQALSALLGLSSDGGTVTWLAGPAGDESLARELGLRLAAQPSLAELELMYGSWDPEGARVLDVVSIMDRLASPGGDPWKREQTHASLARFLLEEAYEACDAIATDDLPALREELGDVLLQVVLHARMAQDAAQPWSIDDLAGDLAEKLIRRNPHVFAGQQVADLDEIMANWEQIKKAEKARTSALDGVVMAQPALALAAKILARAAGAGLDLPLPVAESPVDSAEAMGIALLRLVEVARLRGVDAELALRREALHHADRVRSAESSRSGKVDSHRQSNALGDSE